MDEESRWTEIFASHPIASRITAASIATALEGFPLTPIRDFEWLARAIQPAVYLAANQPKPTKKTSEVRDELARLADQAREVCDRLFDLSDEAENAIWRQAMQLPGATDQSANADLAFINDASERLLGALLIIERAASDDRSLKSQSQKVQQAAERDLLKWFAVWLSPAYEEGYGLPPVFKNADPASRHENGHWADFFRCITSLAFEKPAPYSLPLILRQARSVTKHGRALAVVRFPPGYFPK